MKLTENPNNNELQESIAKSYKEIKENIDAYNIKDTIKNFFTNNISGLTKEENLNMQQKNLLYAIHDKFQNYKSDHSTMINDIAEDIIDSTNKIEKTDITNKHNFIKDSQKELLKYISSHSSTGEAPWENIKDITYHDMNNILSQKSIFLLYQMKDTDNQGEFEKEYQKTIDSYVRYFFAFSISKP